MPRALLLLLLSSALPLPAQAVAAREAELGRQAAAVLLPFARLCEGNKAMPQAKRAWELILDYDSEHRLARTALGQQKAGGRWQQPAKPRQWIDRATRAQREAVEAAWAQVQQQLAALHRALGLELLPQDQAAGTTHLQRALAYDPGDAEAHRALGHAEHQGFFGTPEQVAFLQQLAAFEAMVAGLRNRSYPVAAVPAAQLPPELAKAGLQFHGASSAHFTVWTRTSADEAAACAQWAERARELLVQILGQPRLPELNFAARLQYDFVAFVASASERDQFLTGNPDTWTGQDPGNIRRFDDFFWDRPGGRGALVWTLPERLFDRMVGFVVFQGFLHGRNQGLGEGLLHACTWHLLGTTWTWYGALPSTRAAGDALLQPDPGVWLQRLREQIERGEDWPIQQLPRELLTQYRPQVRIKAWYLMSWLLARHPQQWLSFYLELSRHPVLMPEQIEAIGRQAFGRPLGELEREWREWADGRSALARASGHGR